MGSATRFEQAVEARDPDAMAAALAPDVTFRSPVVFKPYEGRDAVMVILRAVVEVFEDFRYVDRLEGDGSVALIFNARIGERELDGLDLIELDDDGLVTALTVMVRPMSGTVTLAEAMRDQLERMGVPVPGAPA